ncbi:MAG: porin [Roseiarcus sp.]|jgi:porin-like protein
MTLMKSILLGSAAGIVAVAGAQAADLPTKKSAPAEYVRICNVGGMAGFIIPGSDTCLKISGYITGQVEAGNTQTSYTRTGTPGTPGYGSFLTSAPASLRDEVGFTTRANIDFDARTNTAYGVLRGYAELQFDSGSGFDNTGNAGYINLAYVQWAGLTAGKAPSFFSFFGGGEGWANLFSPDQQGFDQPDVLAYTATFGGGFSATIAIQDPEGNSSGPGSNNNPALIDTARYGNTTPDIVGVLRIDQGWGSAQIGAVGHNVHVYATSGAFPGFGVPTQNIWGWAIGGGVSFNLPQFGAADKFAIQADYSQNATLYSGFPEALWGENVGGPPTGPNGNGLGPVVADTYYAGLNAGGGAQWATPTAWTIGATFEHHFSPVFSFDPEVGYGEVNWSGSLGQLSSTTTSWMGGAVAHWDPVPQLDFAFELVYQSTHQSTPGNWGVGSITRTGTPGSVPVVATPAGFPGNSDGFAGRFYMTRNF